MILTDDEIDSVYSRLRGDTFEQALRSVDFARAIEAAILKKIGEPVGWLHTFEKQNGDRETDATTSFAVAKAFCDFGDPIPLYALPGLK